VAIEIWNKNAPTTTVNSGGTDAPASGTQESWTVASSSGFPTASTTTGSQFHVIDEAATSEVISVISVSGTTWTVVRGAESTTPVTHTGGFTIIQVVTAGYLGTTMTTANTTITTLYPSGDNTGATDTAAINNAITNTIAGGIVYLASGIFYTNAPISFGKRVIFQGPDSAMNWGSYNGGYGNNATAPTGFGSTPPTLPSGAIIQPTAGWAQGTAVSAAVLLMFAPTHYITEGPVLKNICVNGVNLSATADGIMGYGAVADVQMTNVYVMRCTGWGINTAADGSAPAGYSINTPGTWKVAHCETWLNGAGGINLNFVADSTWVDVLCEGNVGDGWALTSTDNSHYISCRAEWSSDHGFHLTGAWLSAAGYGCEQTVFTGCTTDANLKNGFYVDATTGTTTVVLNGCSFHRDGNNATPGTWAAFAVNQAGTSSLHYQVVARGIMTTATTAANGIGPSYGLAVTGTGANVDIDGSRLIGRLGAGTITGVPARLQVGPGMSYGTGDSSNPTQVYPANWKSGTAVLAAGSVTVANTSVTALSRIWLTNLVPGGAVGAPFVDVITAGTSFVIHSTSATDTSTIAYRMDEPG
jgi:hypothetical protein